MKGRFDISDVDRHSLTDNNLCSDEHDPRLSEIEAVRIASEIVAENAGAPGNTRIERLARFVLEATMLTLLLAVFADLPACVNMPYRAPEARVGLDRYQYVVKLASACGEMTTFGQHTPDPNVMPLPYLQQWAPDRSATGVIIDDRHVLTAAHAVECAVLPTTDIWLSNKKGWGHRDGELFHTWVERDFGMFPGHGEESDVALLVSASSENFDLSAAPVVVGPAPHIGDHVCIETLHDELCGYWSSGGWVNVKTRPGDSGAPAYDSGGRLVGIVQGNDESGRNTKLTFGRLMEVLQ